MYRNELKTLDVNVINFILQNNKATIEELCRCFDVSQVNIRNVLAKIEFFVKDNNIGILLKENNEYYFENNKLNLNFDYTKMQSKNIEKSERIVYILLKLFFQGTINLTKVSQELDISRITLNADLDYIKDFLKEFDIELLSVQWKGIFLKGDPITLEKVSVLFLVKLYLEEYFTSNLKKIVNPLVIEFFRKHISEETEKKINILTAKLYSHFNIRLGITYYFILKAIIIFNYYRAKENIESPKIDIKLKNDLTETVYDIISEEEKELIGDNSFLLVSFLSYCVYEKFTPIYAFDMDNVLKDIFITFNLKEDEKVAKEIAMFINTIYFHNKFLLPSYHILSEKEMKYMETDISQTFMELFRKHNIPFNEGNIAFLYCYLTYLITESKKKNVIIIDNDDLNWIGSNLKEKIKHLETINEVEVVSYFDFKFYAKHFTEQDKFKTYVFIDLPSEKNSTYPDRECIFINSYDLLFNISEVTSLFINNITD